ncbi:hypothetical protein BH10CYA1_BH10CYA1_56740 [soil metagenome]
MQEEATCLAPGDVIAGQFQVLAKLGSGGMSRVYRCMDLFVERTVAVKVLFAGQTTNPRAINRFRREARAIAKLDHPNIVRLHSFNFDLSAPYIVMESVDGITLAELIETNGPMEVEQVFRLAEQLCSALLYAHQNGVIHRDLKPSNIIIEHFDAAGMQAKVLDFGIAKMLDDTTPGATATGELFGTPSYMSPEQALGKPVDRRTDQYSLGCLLFECLTGTPPFVGSGQLSVLMQHVQSEAPSLDQSTFSGRVFPPQIQPVLDKMLAKFPSDRYDSLAEVYENLTDGQSETDYVVESFSNLIVKAESGLRITQTNLVVDAGPSIIPFWTGIAVGASFLLVILAAIAAIYFSLTAPTLTTAESSHVGYNSTENLLGGIDVEKVFVGGLQHQIRQDRQRKELIVGDKMVNNQDLIALRGANSIESLNLAYCEHIDDSGMAYTWHLPLTNLNLKDTAISDQACKGIAEHFPNLNLLSLQQTSITDQGLRPLVALKHLKFLDLKITEISKPGFYLSKMPSLQTLLLDGSNIEMSDLNISDLRRISANATLVNDSLIAVLLRHKKLETISLNRTAITDNQLLRLASLKNLREINIQDCLNVTASGIKKLHQLNPACKILNIEVGERQREQLFQRWN